MNKKSTLRSVANNYLTHPNERKGITLIALVITIIVLLILAGVTIVTLTGDNGLLQKSGEAKNKTTGAEIGEQLKLVYAEYQIGQYQTPVDIQERLQEIYGPNTTAELSDGKLIVSINGKEYQYDTKTGKSGEYINPINYGTKTKSTIEPGDDITIGETEKFKVFSVLNGVIKAIPYYNITLTTNNPIQSSSAGVTPFYDWPKMPVGEYDVDMDNQENYLQQYILAYKKTLEDMGVSGFEVRAPIKSELTMEGITSELRNPIQSQGYWIGTHKASAYTYQFYYVRQNGNVDDNNNYNNQYGVRPIIIIN